jgi:circadian clock protein KaiC
MSSEVVDRCPTGIQGFDDLCQGGFVRNSDNLIVGGPGSGKSTFLLQFLYKGITQYDENGLYCSFEPDIVDTLNDAMAYGWDFSKLSSEGKIKFMRFSPETSVDELKKELTKMIAQNDIKRICFDPISVFALTLSNQGKIRQKIFELSSLMKKLLLNLIKILIYLFLSSLRVLVVQYLRRGFHLQKQLFLLVFLLDKIGQIFFALFFLYY